MTLSATPDGRTAETREINNSCRERCEIASSVTCRLASSPAQALFSPVLSPSPAAPEAPVPANAPAPAEEEEDLDVLEAVSILVEKGKRSRRVLGPDHPLTVEVLGQLEQALSPTSPFSPTSPLSAAPAPAPPLTVDDV